MIYFYPSRVYAGLKDYRYLPETITGRIMLNPVYKTQNLIPPFKAIVDSGAFQDIEKHQRLTPVVALERQLRYQDSIRLKYIPDFSFESVVIYDQMIGVDECLVDGKKVKQRGTEETAKYAIEETLKSAYYYKTRQNEFESITYVAQGVTPQQYVEDCAAELFKLMRTQDYFGFGGFCIIGRQRKRMLPVFKETCELLFPLFKKHGIKRAHILGVCLPDAITFAANLANQCSIDLSTDSSAPEVNAVAFGKKYNEFGYISGSAGKKWVDYHPIELAHNNVQLYNNYIKQFNLEEV